MRKIINSKTKQYETVSTDEWVLDDEPTAGSFNGITSDGVANAISNISPLKPIGAATVSYLNGTIEGLQPGWMYTLTDSGTLTAGDLEVEAGDEVAWGADGKWFKVGSSINTDAIEQMIYKESMHVTNGGILMNMPCQNRIGQCILKKRLKNPAKRSGTVSRIISLTADQR